MPELYPDFAANSAAFEKAKAFWAALAVEEVNALNQSRQWKKWLHEEEWGDDPELIEGSVVFSLYLEKQNKGFQVQQVTMGAAQEIEPFIYSWTDTFGEGHLENPIPNLLIGGVPTDENIPLIRSIFSNWIDPAVDMNSMNTFLDERLYKPYKYRG